MQGGNEPLSHHFSFLPLPFPLDSVKHCLEVNHPKLLALPRLPSSAPAPEPSQLVPGTRAAGWQRRELDFGWDLIISTPPTPSSEEDIVIEEFARQKLKGEKDDEDEKEEGEKEES